MRRLISAVGIEDKKIGVRILKTALAVVILNIFFGTAFYFAERTLQPLLTYWDSIWWAMVTMTTVGYGDYYAKTPFGRYLISYPCMLVGIGIMGYFITTFAEEMVERVTRFRRGNMTIKSKNHILICNFPGIEKILNLVQELKENIDFKNREVVLITDAFEELPDRLRKLKLAFVKGSPADEDVLKAANFKDCAGVFILVKDSKDENTDAQTLAIASIINMLKKELNCTPRIVVEVINKKNAKMMRFAGVAGMVASEGISDRLMVQEFLYPGIHDIVQQIISNTVGSQFYIFDTRLQGRKLKEIQMAVLDHPENLQVIGVMSGSQQLINPPKEHVILPGDKLIMLAKSKADFESIERDILKS